MDCRDELEANVEVYRRNRALLLEALPRLGLQSIAPPDGAFYIYADVGHLTDNSLEFCKQLLRDTGVATRQGLILIRGGTPVRAVQFCGRTDEVVEAIRRLERWLGERARRG